MHDITLHDLAVCSCESSEQGSSRRSQETQGALAVMEQAWSREEGKSFVQGVAAVCTAAAAHAPASIASSISSRLRGAERGRAISAQSESASGQAREHP